MKKILFLVLLAALLVAAFYLINSMQGDFYLLEVDLPDVAGLIREKFPIRLQEPYPPPYPPPETETPTLTEPAYPPPVTDTPTQTSTNTATNTPTSTLTETPIDTPTSTATQTSTSTSTATEMVNPATSAATATTTATRTLTPDPGFTPTATVPRPQPGGPGNQMIILVSGIIVTFAGLGGILLVWLFAFRGRRLR